MIGTSIIRPAVADAPQSTCHPANRLGLDYRHESDVLGAPPIPIIDAHVHLRDAPAVKLYDEVAHAYGIACCWTMSPRSQIDVIRQAMRHTQVRFTAVPEWGHPDPAYAMGKGFLDAITEFHAEGSRLVKFWAAPRARDIGRETGVPDLMDLTGPWRRRQMEHAASLGMGLMTHIADPDTWFQSVYRDEDQYGTKAAQYEQFERALEAFPVPWLAAHMGGWPEDLDFLDTLLERYDYLHLDTSATKWMVRTLSAHDQEKIESFFARWKHRILFGSDIVAVGEHLTAGGDTARADQAGTSMEAYDLYASRYWALRTMFERPWTGPSPIADPDLHQVDPDRYTPMDAPTLVGRAFSKDILTPLYQQAADRFAQSLGMP